MSADWRAGDKALCIGGGWDDRRWAWREIGSMPVEGTIYLVDEVVLTATEVGLQLNGHKTFPTVLGRLIARIGGAGYSSTQFRKIVPISERATAEAVNSNGT